MRVTTRARDSNAMRRAEGDGDECDARAVSARGTRAGGCARDVAMMMRLGKRADSSRVWIEKEEDAREGSGDAREGGD